MSYKNNQSLWLKKQQMEIQALMMENRKLRNENRNLKIELSSRETMAEEGRLSSRFHGFTSIVQEARMR
ncbi:hypothetical protein GHK52_01865 [Lactococcus garvieae]|nr:hypothetical protein [Lactococcus garvieae]